MGLSGLGGGTLKIYPFSRSDFDSNTTTTLSFDVSSVPGYQSLTVDNFYIAQAGVNPKSTAQAGSITRTYNAGSGILTVQLSAGTAVSFMPPVNVVCVTAE